MARPKSTKPIKDKILSVRLTKEDYVKIKKVYGSVQAFLDLMIKTLPIVLLMACKAPMVPSELDQSTKTASKTLVEESYEINTNMYAKITNDSFFGYELSVKCSETQCFLTGRLLEGKNNRTSVYGSVINTDTILERSGDYAYGQICTSQARCYDAVLFKTELLAIKTAGRCHKASINTNKSDLDNSLVGLTYFNADMSLENSISESECQYE